MSDRIERPSFFEGQVLAANDLTAGVDYERGQLARHERYLHSWGIATGLELKKTPNKDALGNAFVDVTVTAGVAIDGTGREIVVPVDVDASPADFEDTLVALPSDGDETWYPVMLSGYDESAPAMPLLPTGCNGTSSTRTLDQYSITFGRMNLAAALDQQLLADVGDGPRSTTADSWKVLLGFVTWSKALKRFTDVSPQRGTFSRRYAGVQADTVAARAGALTLQTQVKSTPGKPGVVLSEEKGGMLKFGLLDAAGGVSTPVFAVDAAGNVTGLLATGNVLVESGMATDGMILPLPLGVTPAQVASGAAILHAQISLRVDASSPPAAGAIWAASPLEVHVDADRRVHCRVRWFDAKVPPATAATDRPGVCDYVVLATTPAK